jgi:hypothetical protein
LLVLLCASASRAHQNQNQTTPLPFLSQAISGTKHGTTANAPVRLKDQASRCFFGIEPTVCAGYLLRKRATNNLFFLAGCIGEIFQIY